MRGRIMPSGITSGDPARPRSYSSTTQDHPQNLPKICIEFLDGASAWHLASPDTSSPQSWSASVRPTSATLLCMAMDAAPVAKRHVDVAAIQRLLDRIVARWNPQQVWLFGSRARGDATRIATGICSSSSTTAPRRTIWIRGSAAGCAENAACAPM